MKEALEFHVQGMIEDGNEVPQWLVEGDYEFK
jgi:predicted RNase H-like HicB family nuclease